MWHTRVTIPPSGLLPAIGAGPSVICSAHLFPTSGFGPWFARFWPSFASPSPTFSTFVASLSFVLHLYFIFPRFPVEPLGIVRIICRLLYFPLVYLFCFFLTYFTFPLFLLLHDLTRANKVE